MPVPSPAIEAVTLFNELVDLPWSESARIRQIEVRLRRLFELRPDVLTGLSLSNARAMLGMYAAANELLPWLRTAIVSSDRVLIRNFTALALDLGHFELAIELADSRQDLAYLGMYAAFHSGNAEALWRFAAEAEHKPMLDWLAKLEAANLVEPFRDLQAAIREVMNGKFTACEISLSNVGEDSACIYYSWLERAERRQLEYEIDLMVQALAERHGTSWLDYPLITTILPLGAHPGYSA